MDLAHGSSFYPSAEVRAGDLDELLSTDILVMCAGRVGRSDELRLDLLKDNANIASGIAERFKQYGGIVIVVANTVDVLTQVFQETSGLDPSRVIDTGTMLDTSRLRETVGRALDLSPRSIHAHVVGEHGDSEVVLWSSARSGGTALREWPRWRSELETPIASEVRTAATEIIKRKGATNHAIGLVTASLVGYVLRDERRVLTVSRLQTEGDCAGVTLSLPATVTANGATDVVTPSLTEDERRALRASADVIRAAVDSI